MKNKLFISLLLVILLGTLGIFLYNRNSSSSIPDNSQNTDNNQITDNGETLSVLQTTVIDGNTKEPVTNAIVYLGTGFHQCYTDSKGWCQITDFSWGDYALSARKKGYDRFTTPSHFEKGENNITIKLQKRPSVPESFVIEGIIIEVVTAEGTKSENHYFKIKELSETEEYLFNDVERNEGFGFLNKKVRITGYKGTGFIGWQSKQVEGIFVEKVEDL